MKPEQLKRLAEAQGKRAEICRGPDSELLGVYLLDDEGRVTERYQPDVDKAQAMDVLEWMCKKHKGYAVGVCAYRLSGFFNCGMEPPNECDGEAVTLPEAITLAALSMLESE